VEESPEAIGPFIYLAVKLLKSAASIRETDLFAFNLIFL
jgi:hypothetical protein